jgi:THO complex subunit 3
LTLPPAETLECHRGTCSCIAIDPTEKYFATGAADAIIAIWDLEEMSCLRCYTKLEGQIRQLSFSHDGRYIATASDDEVMEIISSETG